MRASRARKRRAGFRIVQTWISTNPPVYSDHLRLDARSLALHCLVARKIMADSALIKRARSILNRWKAQTAEPRPSYFAEWADILQRRPEEVAGYLMKMNDDATRLRQSSPFATLLTKEERARIYSAFS